MDAFLFILKKCITAYLLPPGVFVLALLFLCWRLWRRRQRGFAAAGLLLALLVWLFSLSAISDILHKQLERGLTMPKKPQGDVIILLGGGVHDRVPDLTGTGAPAEEMMVRIVTAVRLQRQLDLPVIVSGGVVYKDRAAEAPIVRRFLLDMGVPDRRIILEKKSRDTMENARFSREIMKQHGFNRPILVTSAFHMRRSIEAFKRCGITVTPLPAGFKANRGAPFIWADFLPDAGALHGTATVSKEYLGLLFYRLSGKIQR